MIDTALTSGRIPECRTRSAVQTAAPAARCRRRCTASDSIAHTTSTPEAAAMWTKWGVVPADQHCPALAEPPPGESARCAHFMDLTRVYSNYPDDLEPRQATAVANLDQSARQRPQRPCRISCTHKMRRLERRCAPDGPLTCVRLNEELALHRRRPKQLRYRMCRRAACRRQERS